MRDRFTIGKSLPVFLILQSLGFCLSVLNFENISTTELNSAQIYAASLSELLPVGVLRWDVILSTHSGALCEMQV